MTTHLVATKVNYISEKWEIQTIYRETDRNEKCASEIKKRTARSATVPGQETDRLPTESPCDRDR